MKKRLVRVVIALSFLFLALFLSSCSDSNLYGNAVDGGGNLIYIESITIHTPENGTGYSGEIPVTVSIIAPSTTVTSVQARLESIAEGEALPELEGAWNTLQLTDATWTGTVGLGTFEDNVYVLRVNASEQTYGTSVIAIVDAVAIDRSPPVFPTYAPVDALTTNESNVSFTATVDDLGEQNVTLLIDDQPIVTMNATESGTYEAVITLTNGTHTWRWHVIDSARLNFSTGDRTITYVNLSLANLTQNATTNTTNSTNATTNATTNTTANTTVNVTLLFNVSNPWANVTSAYENDSIRFNITAYSDNQTIVEAKFGSMINSTLSNVSNNMFSAITTPRLLGCSQNATCTIRYYIIDDSGKKNESTTFSLFVNATLPALVSAPAQNVTNTTKNTTVATTANKTILAQPKTPTITPPTQPAYTPPATQQPAQQQQSSQPTTPEETTAPEPTEQAQLLVKEQPATTIEESPPLGIIIAVFVIGIILLGMAGYLIHSTTIRQQSAPTQPPNPQQLPRRASSFTSSSTSSYSSQPASLSEDLRRQALLQSVGGPTGTSPLDVYEVKQPRRFFRSSPRPQPRLAPQLTTPPQPTTRSLPPTAQRSTYPVTREETVVRERPLDRLRKVANNEPREESPRQHSSRLSTDYQEQLEEFITKSTKLGYPPREIARTLLDKGWSLEHVHEAFKKRGWQA